MSARLSKRICRRRKLCSQECVRSTSTHYFYFFTRDFNTEEENFTAFVKAMGERAFWNEGKPMLVAQTGAYRYSGYHGAEARVAFN